MLWICCFQTSAEKKIRFFWWVFSSVFSPLSHFSFTVWPVCHQPGLAHIQSVLRDINKPQVNGFFSWNILEIYRFTARKGRQLNSKVWSVVCCCFNIFVWNTSIWKEDCLYVATFTTNFVNGDRILGSKLAWDTNQTPGWRAPVTSHIPFILLVFLASFMAYCSPP